MEYRAIGNAALFGTNESLGYNDQCSAFVTATFHHYQTFFRFIQKILANLKTTLLLSPVFLKY